MATRKPKTISQFRGFKGRFRLIAARLKRDASKDLEEDINEANVLALEEKLGIAAKVPDAIFDNVKGTKMQFAWQIARKKEIEFRGQRINQRLRSLNRTQFAFRTRNPKVITQRQLDAV